MPNWIFRDLTSGIEGAVDLDHFHHIEWDEDSLEIRFIRRSELVHEPGRDDLVGPHKDIRYRHDDEAVWFCRDQEDLGATVQAILKFLGAKQIPAPKVARKAARKRS